MNSNDSWKRILKSMILVLIASHLFPLKQVAVFKAILTNEKNLIFQYIHMYKKEYKYQNDYKKNYYK